MRALRVAPLVLGGLLSACSSDGEGPQQTAQPKPIACMIASDFSGSAYNECYNGWPVTRCAPPNKFLLDQTCADQGLCRDSCSGSWVACDKARGPEACQAGGSGNSNEGDRCGQQSDCASGLVCNHYLENASNERRCMRPCARHADCPGTKHPDFAAPLSACFYCNSGGFGSLSQPVCVPLNVCGAGSVPGGACDECLKTCRGLPSCCTGEGCMCEAEC